jgi:hypothetical protein
MSSTVTVDNLLTNKYFVIALIVVILVLIYMWTQKSDCKVNYNNERMNNVDLSRSAQNLSEKPYLEDDNNMDIDTYPYKRYNNAFDKYADASVKTNLVKDGYKKYTDNFLPGTTQREKLYQKYNTQVRDKALVYKDAIDETYNANQIRLAKKGYNGIKLYEEDLGQDYLPIPLNDRPDLSQCQPCKPCTRKHQDDQTESESEYDYDYKSVPIQSRPRNTPRTTPAEIRQSNMKMKKQLPNTKNNVQNKNEYDPNDNCTIM